jgi:hypothetical protein
MCIVQIVLSQVAPLFPHVEEFLQVVMCVPIQHGYGMNLLPCFIFYYFYLFDVPGGSGSFCLTLPIQLSVENITYHLCY